jgi:hypothetical protein
MNFSDVGVPVLPITRTVAEAKPDSSYKSFLPQRGNQYTWSLMMRSQSRKLCSSKIKEIKEKVAVD